MKENSKPLKNILSSNPKVTATSPLEKMVNGMNLKEVPLHHVCEVCIVGKHQRMSFPKDEATRASKLLELVHNDVCGLMKATFHGGARYFVTLINDFFRKIQRNERCLTNSRHKRLWWKLKPT
jgi:hypothetical protein